MAEMLANVPDTEIIGKAGNALEAIAAINRLHPDVVFLDIQMPQISGLQLLTMLDPERMPHIVFVTAFDEFAVKAFEEHAFDCLLKPVESGRLAKTLARLRPRPQPAIRRRSGGQHPSCPVAMLRAQPCLPYQDGNRSIRAVSSKRHLSCRC